MAWRRRPAVVAIHRLRVQGRTILVPKRVWLAHLVSSCGLKDAPQRENEVAQADRADESISRFLRNDRTPLMASTKVWRVYAQDDIDGKIQSPQTAKGGTGRKLTDAIIGHSVLASLKTSEISGIISRWLLRANGSAR